MELNSGSTPHPSARDPGLCFPLSSPGSLGWGHTLGRGRAGGGERREVRAPGVLLTLRSGPPIVFGARWLDSGVGRKMDRHARI